MPHSVLTDGKEQSLGALICKRFEDRLCISGPWAVVESQHHLAFAKEIVSLELLEAETGAARGINLNERETPSASGFSQMGFEEAVSAISNAAALASGRNASGGAEVDGPCRSICTGTRCEEAYQLRVPTHQPLPI